MRYIVVNSTTNIIENVILWDDVSQWSPPDGCFAVQNDTLNIGDRYTP